MRCLVRSWLNVLSLLFLFSALFMSNRQEIMIWQTMKGIGESQYLSLTDGTAPALLKFSEKRGNSENWKRKYWKPIVVTIAIGGTVYLIFTVRSK